MAKLDLVQVTLDLLILKTLSRGPMHGYAIVRRIQAASNDALQIEEGSLYPALHRMERRGWIISKWGLSEHNRRAKYYRLARPGRLQLEADESTWERFTEAVSKVLQTAGKGA